MSVRILGCRRFELNGEVYLCLHAFTDEGPASIKERLCLASELPTLPPEREDELIAKMGKRLTHRPWWRSLLAALTFKPKENL